MELTLDCIIGSHLDGIGYAADMMWVALAPSCKIQWIQEPATVDFHFQCDTGIYLGPEYITGTKDLRCGKDSHPRFETAIQRLLEKGNVFQVESACVDEKLNMTIQFTNGLRLRTTGEGIFDSGDERWRILIHGSEAKFPHLIAVGDHIEIS